jgi:hypothetical protein
MILIRRNNEIYGPFEKEFVEDMVIEGRVTLNDEAKNMHCANWDTLVKVLYPHQEVQKNDLPLNAQQSSKQAAIDRQYIAAYMEGEGQATWAYRFGTMGRLIIIGIICLFIPVIGWVIGPIIIVTSPAALFDSRSGPTSFRNRVNRIIGGVKNDGYQDRHGLGIAIILSIISFALILNGMWKIYDNMAVGTGSGSHFGMIIVGVILWIPIIGQIYKYFVPKQDRQ